MGTLGKLGIILKCKKHGKIDGWLVEKYKEISVKYICKQCDGEGRETSITLKQYGMSQKLISGNTVNIAWGPVYEILEVSVNGRKLSANQYKIETNEGGMTTIKLLGTEEKHKGERWGR